MMYQPRAGIFPSVMLILIGSMDCITTIIGTAFYGAFEVNPFLVGLVSNIPLFTIIKFSATLCIGLSYFFANRILHQTGEKSSKSFRYTNLLVKGTYAGLAVFLSIVVVNNLAVILA